MTGLVLVPALDHDAMMLARFGQAVGPSGRLERRIVANLIAHMEEAGFRADRVFDGEDDVHVIDMKSAMELIFNLDEATLWFFKEGAPHKTHGVFLVLGNGCDIVSDWSYSDRDGDGFDAAMRAFEPEEFA